MAPTILLFALRSEVEQTADFGETDQGKLLKDAGRLDAGAHFERGAMLGQLCGNLWKSQE